MDSLHCKTKRTKFSGLCRKQNSSFSLPSDLLYRLLSQTLATRQRDDSSINRQNRDLDHEAATQSFPCIVIDLFVRQTTECVRQTTEWGKCFKGNYASNPRVYGRKLTACSSCRRWSACSCRLTSFVKMATAVVIL